MVVFPRRGGNKMLLLCALQVFYCISVTVPGPSVTTANGQLSAHGADDLLTNHRFSEDDLKIQEYKANFPQLHIPPIRQPKTGETNAM
ncbi:hypothetical protein Pst134EA_004747 [Puccinia striiformis f. sp. tritici]|uniref:hypothetical protein n=1 Tax=Puccinia striiformis f. sp. tritici TaxID=168172 RepID=UPI00200724B7|nr:hypothetical protein Pst134EA_004747 [Puccinia striiformis f. sp. tritici]KAH9470829.1 hypothetical protein Pst134EA_004747 [Puccinia striiformis f. sp. tritici]